ncbi:MAG: DUF1641 domain-containing protein [candidate division KSB1 bacterium]|nr:DUF1641 domain-containing protein [candidate division KSB1 bacterium]MDQ7066235.1 DUF1641 domain-containing protein [candidate division KSB1 bacterium]
METLTYQETNEQQLAEINRKLDFIVEQMKIEARQRQERQELKDDLNRIAVDMFQTAVEELNEVAHHFDSQDLLHLLKRLMRNTRNLIKLLDQLESLSNFVQDAAPIGKEAFLDLLYTLNELDRKGYFDFMKELLKIVDRIVTSFTVEDVKALGDNIVTILNTVKNLTQPEMLHAINNAVSVYKNLDISVKEEISYWDIIKAARTPEMKRGMAFAIQFLKNLAETQFNSNDKANHQESQSYNPKNDEV